MPSPGTVRDEDFVFDDNDDEDDDDESGDKGAAKTKIIKKTKTKTTPQRQPHG